MSKRRSGYALFQLMAVVALILLLLGLLLPAIQAARRAATRAESTNNLKQIGLALHNYHDVNNRLPAGEDANHYSCLVHLLPYIEQDNLFKALDLTTDLDKSNSPVPNTIVKVFVSTLDPVDRPSQKTAPTNYFAVAGTKHALADNDGILYRQSATAFAGVTDGLSNTMFFVESLKGDGVDKAVTVARQHVQMKKGRLKNLKDTEGVDDFKNGKNIAGDRGSSWADGRFLKATMTATLKVNDDRPDVDCEGDGGLFSARSSQESVNALMADGSVRAVSQMVSLATWQVAATRSGGEVLGNDF